MDKRTFEPEDADDSLATSELRSETVTAFLSAKPGMLVKWGTSIFGLILVLCLVVCWLIQYPEVISTRAVLTSINGPKPIVSHVDGKLVKLKCKEGETVHKGDILGYMESTGSFDEVVNLASEVDSIRAFMESGRISPLMKLRPHPYKRLGELQDSYEIFTQAFLNYRNYLPGELYSRKLSMLNMDMVYLRKLESLLEQQKVYQGNDLDLAQKNFDADRELNNDKIVADREFRIEQGLLLGKKMGIPQISAAIVSNESMQNEKGKEILELKSKIMDQGNIFDEALNTLRSRIGDWVNKFVFSAPFDGKITFSAFIQEGEQLRSGQSVLFVKPENKRYFAQMLIPQQSFGKVRVGQEVLLRFSAYPYQEFGTIIGNIDFISKIPSDSGYLAKVVLAKGLKTDYNREIEFTDGLIANADIITQEMKLLQRFYNNTLKGLKR